MVLGFSCPLPCTVSTQRKVPAISSTLAVFELATLVITKINEYCQTSTIHRSSNYTCGILAEPKELVEDSESLRATANAVALIGGLSIP